MILVYQQIPKEAKIKQQNLVMRWIDYKDGR